LETVLCNRPGEPSDPQAAIIDIGKSYDVFAGLLERKARQPHVPIEGSAALVEADAALSQARSVVENYNKAVQVANQIIAELKRGTDQGDLQTAKVQMTRLEAIKHRHEPEGTRACEDVKRLDERKRNIEATKAQVREQLEAHTRDVIEPYESRINEFLDMFNADFHLVGTTHSYPGGIATSSYQLLINNRRVDLGDARTPKDQPSFKTLCRWGIG
jgi:hypothetical protein